MKLESHVDSVFNLLHCEIRTERATFCVPQTSSTSNYFWTRKLPGILIVESKF